MVSCLFVVAFRLDCSKALQERKADIQELMVGSLGDGSCFFTWLGLDPRLGFDWVVNLLEGNCIFHGSCFSGIPDSSALVLNPTSPQSP